MKKLSRILKQDAPMNFPVIGRNGYAGEQEEGLRVVYYAGECRNLIEAGSILIPNKCKLQFANYHHANGWTFSIATWNNDPELSQCRLIFL